MPFAPLLADYGHLAVFIGSLLKGACPACMASTP